ncbi:alpha-galactosidase [Actinoplanes sp. GCM10030250]|uniref:glycoside hydrolase family 36 protein n=1 Tax=Actinoplanes sp. GCM10030250 TaxID=3273376 RepID=UPI0036179DA9
MTVTLPGLAADAEQQLTWGNDVLRLVIAHGPDTAPRLVALWHTAEPQPDLAGLRRSALPILEVALAGEGRSGTSGKRHVDGAAGQRMRLGDSGAERRDGVARLRLHLADERSGLRATVHYELAEGTAVLRSWAELTCDRPVTVEHVTTGAVSGIGHGARWENEVALWTAANPWSGEFRWRRATLAEHGLHDVGMTRFQQVGSKNRISLTSTGAWSTSEHLAMGIVEDSRTGRMLAWQVESNTTWHVELGDRYDDVYLAVFGPTLLEHQWKGRLDRGGYLRTVAVALAVVPGSAEGALTAVSAALAAHRRRIRRPHRDHGTLPVVYNDFLNALMADPTTERELPLIEAAADLGVETFVIDAGWYDDEAGGWWDSVGTWEPSVTRFPGGGLDAVIDRIRGAGMTPGLWLEPEVIGLRSPVAHTLPDEAFFQRDGVRVAEWGRYQLDLRHPAARAHLDAVVDGLVARFGLGYLKFDYNVDTGPGTDGGIGEPAGAGLLGHGRALLDWVAAVMDRHPGLVVEGCAAGGSRTDPASEAVFPIQSLTDQQDFRAMPPIAAAAPLAIPPEQAGIWASADGSMNRDELAFSLISAMLGRIHLAGRIDTLNPQQRAVLRDGLAVYRDIRAAVARSTPVWPLGLPGWRDPWIVVGARDADDLYLAVWRRDGGDDVLQLDISGHATVLFPAWGSVSGGTELEIRLAPYSALLLNVKGIR